MPSGYKGKLTITCQRCGKESKHYAKGLCQSCYLIAGKEKVICERCGKEKTKYAKGLCASCYHTLDLQTNQERRNAHNETAKRNADLHRDEINARARERYQNPEIKERERIRKHNEYQKNKEKLTTRIKRWIKGNPDYLAQKRQRRKARHANVERTLSGDDWKQILKEHNYACHYCGKKGSNLHQEHKIPLIRGGGYTRENIVPSCPECNSRKHTRTEEEFLQLLKSEQESGE